VLAAVGMRHGMDVIDLCSGDGWFTLQIAKIAARVTAIDVDPTLLEVARNRLGESGAANCEFAAGDAYDLSKLAKRPADFVFLANAFHGVPDRPRLARAVGAALKPGGLRGGKLAQAPEGGDGRSWRGARPADRTADVSRGNDC
jgi:ubiquinone/menaquinone biosynthesis C-methylase UbiE